VIFNLLFKGRAFRGIFAEFYSLFKHSDSNGLVINQKQSMQDESSADLGSASCGEPSILVNSE
jgi:hypothetical protein